MSEYILLGIALLFLCISITELRSEYSHEIYGIWYVFFLVFLLFAALYFVAEKDNQEIAHALGPSFSDALSTIHHLLTDIPGELLLVGAIVYIGILPQLLTYVFSGLSGSASAPIFVRQIGLIAVWSLIKFFAGLAGILLAQSAAKLYWGKPVLLQDVAKGVGILAAAFLTDAAQHQYLDRTFELRLLQGRLWIRFNVPALRWVHDRFTRHRLPVQYVGNNATKDAAILAATAAATVAVTVMRDPTADATTIAQKVVEGIAALEEATRPTPGAPAMDESQATEKAAPVKRVEMEWIVTSPLVSFRLGGSAIDWIDDHFKRNVRIVQYVTRDSPAKFKRRKAQRKAPV